MSLPEKRNTSVFVVFLSLNSVCSSDKICVDIIENVHLPKSEDEDFGCCRQGSGDGGGRNNCNSSAGSQKGIILYKQIRKE